LEFGSPPFTEPLVDFEATVLGLASSGFITPLERQRLLEAGRATHFTERTIERVASAVLATGRAEAVVAAYVTNRIGVKARDAQELVQRLRCLPDRLVQRPGWQLAETATLRELLAEHRLNNVVAA
jgi:hypothetical protein